MPSTTCQKNRVTGYKSNIITQDVKVILQTLVCLVLNRKGRVESISLHKRAYYFLTASSFGELNEAGQAWAACKKWAKGRDLSCWWTWCFLLDFHYLRQPLASGSCEAAPQPLLLQSTTPATPLFLLLQSTTPATPLYLVPGSHPFYLLNSCTMYPFFLLTPLIGNTFQAKPYEMKGYQPPRWVLPSSLISHNCPFLLSLSKRKCFF